MTRLHKEKPVLFAVLWIVIYVVGLSLADSASAALSIRSVYHKTGKNRPYYEMNEYLFERRTALHGDFKNIY